MKTLSKSLSIDSRLLDLYKPLVRRLLIVLAVTFVLAQSALLYFDERLVDRLSSDVIRGSGQLIASGISRLFELSSTSIMIAAREVGHLPLDARTPDEALLSRLSPFLVAYPFLDSINVADADGNEFVVIRDDAEYLVRRFVAANSGTAQWQRWRDGEQVEAWERAFDELPAERPWFEGAMARDAGERFWTAPYAFLTTEAPGVSVATRMRSTNASGDAVIAFNLALDELSRHTVAHRPSENGVSLVLASDGRTLGVPADPRFSDPRSILSATLVPAADLGIPAVSAALEEWESRDRAETRFGFRLANGETWKAGFSLIPLDDDHAVWSAVLVPKADLVGGIVTRRNLSIAGILVLGALTAGGLLVTAMRSVRRQLKAAVDRVEQELGQYRIKQRIGAGGNGTVYRAHHALLRRPTALKLMNPAFAKSDAARERFEHEVRLTSGLSHPNTISIYDFGRTADGTLYYAMELLVGGTLNRVVQLAGPLPPSRVIHFLSQTCGSLAEAHAKGLIHRDIKPSNLIACERGGIYDVVKVVDFGLVKEIAETDGNLTQADVLVGTPFFMAPETISRAGAASPKSDLYALGAVGYYLLTARQVFEGASAVEICAAHLHDEPVPPSTRAGLAVPEDLEAIVLACLAKDPDARPGSAREMYDALQACADAGAWTQDDAQAWWQENASGLEGRAADMDDVPMSRTELIVDLDTRLAALNPQGES